MPHDPVALNAWIEVNGTNLSEWMRVTSYREYSSQYNATGLGDAWTSDTEGPKTAELAVTWLADFHQHGPYRTLAHLVGQTALVRFQPNGPVRSGDNPLHQGMFRISEWTTIDARHGDLSEVSSVWTSVGPIEKFPEAYFRGLMTVGTGGQGRGFRLNSYGTLEPSSFFGGDVPGAPAAVNTLTFNVTQVTWQNGTLRIAVDNNARALALAGDFLVVEGSDRSILLSPTPGTNEYYDLTLADPGWAVGDTAKVELWSADPDPP